MLTKFREPVSGLTHLFGALISIIGMIFMIIYERRMPNANPLSYTAIVIFGVSLILLYSASTTYHLVKSTERVIKNLRKLDHAAIYILIAGTYTPICLMVLQGTLKWVMLIVIWSLALLGVVLKLIWLDAPRWLSTLFYVLLGWIAIFIISPISKAMKTGGLVLLISGGILYTIGALIYATKWPKISCKFFGFHEIFHIFVLGGSLCHYFMVLLYIL